MNIKDIIIHALARSQIELAQQIAPVRVGGLAQSLHIVAGTAYAGTSPPHIQRGTGEPFVLESLRPAAMTGQTERLPHRCWQAIADGTSVPDDATFCPFCGERLLTQP